MSFFAPSPPPPPPLPPLPSREDPAIEEARRRQLVAARRAKGRASTILTGGAGDPSDAPVQRKTLLGE
ncbi:MAG: hypothetical protein ACKVSF_10230 [Alphaproteobacteria bacterium]